MVERLTDPQIEEALSALSGWARTSDRHAIEKSFKFKDFKEAWSFMNAVASLAEDMDHHPEWSNIYNKVDITLTTHDAGGISQRDITMAKAINEI